MANFEVYWRHEIRSGSISIQTVAQLLAESLSKYYHESDIHVTPTGIQVEGNLKSFWERAVTKAEVRLGLADGQLSCRVDGESSLGWLPWVWFFLGWFTGFFFFWFLFDLVEYLLSQDRPKQYFEEALRAVQFRIEEQHRGGCTSVKGTARTQLADQEGTEGGTMAGYTFECPHCNELFEVAESSCGQVIHCPSCERLVKFPAVGSPPEASSTPPREANGEGRGTVNEPERETNDRRRVGAVRQIRKKNLPLAIGLNIVLPGLGYIYMGRFVIGIVAAVLTIGYIATEPSHVGQTWAFMNLIMCIDMFFLSSKNRERLTEETMRQCPFCAEMIKKQAMLCRFCNNEVDPEVDE